ncbi:MAG: hypothetical protein WDN00_10535 [Limisphaerales bacterium]
MPLIIVPGLVIWSTLTETAEGGNVPSGAGFVSAVSLAGSAAGGRDDFRRLGIFRRQFQIIYEEADFHVGEFDAQF